MGLKPLQLDQRVIEPLEDSELNALVKACSGTDMCDRRDEAMVRSMAETGTRVATAVGSMTEYLLRLHHNGALGHL